MGPNDEDASTHPLLRDAQQRDCTLGDVLLTSGLCRTSQGNYRHALDWALIAVRETRLAAGSGVWSNGPSRSTQEFLQDNKLEFRQPASGKKVYKEGAKTNMTCAVLANDVAEVRTTHTLPGGETVVVHHQEHVVLDDRSFFGNSGAAVRYYDGTIVGILWGGVYRLSPQHDWPEGPIVIEPLVPEPLCLTSITLVTPLQTLLEDMKAEIAKKLGGIEFTLQPPPHGQGNQSL
ncbi:hypothetical protein B0I37DRAFT_118706 [Chaetomium sp. MPI-CAGE-AT-0009]|nr:hypothetical protein B0I37DRAFT_118706 [Chaetomium sp. MPI-CAGE-AT-0009]